MSISADALLRLSRLGLSNEQLFAIMEILAEAANPRRSAGAERQARYRNRVKERNAVTSPVTSPVTSRGDASTETSSPTLLPREEKKEREEKVTRISNEILVHDGSPEGRFWARAPEFAKLGISRAQLGALLNAADGAFDEAMRVLDDVAKAKEPRSYLAAIVRNLKGEPSASGHAVRIRGDPAKIPQWVRAARSRGEFVTKEGKSWRHFGSLYDDAGNEVGW